MNRFNKLILSFKMKSRKLRKKSLKFLFLMNIFGGRSFVLLLIQISVLIGKMKMIN